MENALEVYRITFQGTSLEMFNKVRREIQQMLELPSSPSGEVACAVSFVMGRDIIFLMAQGYPVVHLVNPVTGDKLEIESNFLENAYYDVRVHQMKTEGGDETESGE